MLQFSTQYPCRSGHSLSEGMCVQESVMSPQISWVSFVKHVTRGYKKAANWSHAAAFVELLWERAAVTSFLKASLAQKQWLLAEVVAFLSLLSPLLCPACGVNSQWERWRDLLTCFFLCLILECLSHLFQILLGPKLFVFLFTDVKHEALWM